MTTETRPMAERAGAAGRAWQDSIQALLSGYGDHWQQWSEISGNLYGMNWLSRPELRAAVERIADNARDMTAAQVSVTGEWLRAPFWVTGHGSPRDLQSSYARLFQAQRGLARAYIDAALEVQRGLLGAAEQAADTARGAVDTQMLTARRIANDTREVEESAVDTARQAARRANQAATRLTNGARTTAESVVEAAEQAAQHATEQAEVVKPGPRAIKGNTGAGGEKIYHLPGQPNYDRLDAEETFTTEAEAQAAGYRRAQTRGGGEIKGNVNARGEKIYHVPGQVNYDRVEAEALFETEEQAREAGFRPAQR